MNSAVSYGRMIPPTCYQRNNNREQIDASSAADYGTESSALDNRERKGRIEWERRKFECIRRLKENQRNEVDSKVKEKLEKETRMKQRMIKAAKTQMQLLNTRSEFIKKNKERMSEANDRFKAIQRINELKWRDKIEKYHEKLLHFTVIIGIYC